MFFSNSIEAQEFIEITLNTIQRSYTGYLVQTPVIEGTTLKEDLITQTIKNVHT